MVDGFLSSDEIASLLEYYNNSESGLNKGFHASSHSNSIAYRAEVNKRIGEVFSRNASRYFRGYQSLFSAFTVKECGPESFFDFHLDWSMLNEDKHVSLSIWSPLVDVNKLNGHLWVLSGSHKLGKTIRGGPGLFLYAPQSTLPLGSGVFDKHIIEGRAGLAVIYDHRLVHGSPPNMGNDRRIAVNHTMIPEGISSLHYSLNKDKTEIRAYQVDTAFYCTYNMMTEPPDVLPKVGEELVSGKFLSQADVNNLEAQTVLHQSIFK